MAVLWFVLRGGSGTLHRGFQVISSRDEGVTLIFPIKNKIKIRKNRRHSFIFDRSDLKFFVWSLGAIAQNRL